MRRGLGLVVAEAAADGRGGRLSEAVVVPFSVGFPLMLEAFLLRAAAGDRSVALCC